MEVNRKKHTNFYAKCHLYPLIYFTICCVFPLVTNINDAVLRGVNMLVKDRQEKRLPEKSIDMIILLTDGMPNSGEHAESEHIVGYTVYLS